MREALGWLVALALAGCGSVAAKSDAGGGGDSGGSGDGSMTTDGGIDAPGTCTPSACASGYCDPGTDMCLPETSAIYVDPTGTDSATCGTKAAPCATIAGTAGALTKIGPVRKVVILAAGTYTEALRIAVPVTIYGPAATIIAPTVGITVQVEGSTTDVRLEGVTIKSAAAGDTNSHTVYCQTSSTVRLVNATVSDAKGYGVYAAGCAVVEIVGGTIQNGARNGVYTAFAAAGAGKITITGTTVTGNVAGGVTIQSTGDLFITSATITNNTGVGVYAGGPVLTMDRALVKGNKFGVEVFGSAYTIRNSIVVENGLSTSSFGGVAIKNTADRTPQIFEFNTVANNTGATLARNISCQVTAASPASINDSIAFGGTGAAPSYANGGNCSVTYSNIEGGVAGTGNISTAPTFKSASDYHLTAASAGVNAANPGSTITVDFDNESRPSGAGPDMGADEVH